MGQSFEDWFNGKQEEKPEVKEPEKFYDYDDELPHDVDFGDTPGTYIFRCRGCDKWKPMDWELSEDSFESHWCGGSPYCCPLVPTPVWSKHKRMMARPAQPPAAPPMPPVKRGVPKPSPATHFQCVGCHQWYPVKNAHRLPDGRMICGSYGCVPTPATVKDPHLRCGGCGKAIPPYDSPPHHLTGEAFCGDRYCKDRLTHEYIMKQRQPKPPRAG